MKSFLTDREKEFFSHNELTILDILGKKTMKITELAKELYDGVTPPLHATVVVSNALSRIVEKCKYHGLPFSIAYEGKAGRNGKSVRKTK